MYKTALIITGNEYDTDWDRQPESFYIQNLQYCYTGFGLQSDSEPGRDFACYVTNNEPGYSVTTKAVLSTGVPPGPNNNQNGSVFQGWMAAGTLHGEYDELKDFWDDLDEAGSSTNTVLAAGNGMIPILNAPYNQFYLFTEAPVGDNDRNLPILVSNLAIAANLFTPESINVITQNTGNKQLDLMQAVLEGQSPVKNRQFFQNYLNSMPMSGPYNFVAKNSSNSITINQGAENGWASEDRWTWSADANGGENCVGIFNGIDYMLLHNLYRLVFPDNQPIFSPEQSQVEECFCGSAPSASDVGQPALEAQLNQKFNYVPVCTENVFQYQTEIQGTFNITTYFPEYTAMKIYTNKFQTENTSFEPGASVFVHTPFIVCNNSTLNIKSGSLLKIVDKHMKVNSGSTIDVRGELYVHGGTDLIVKSGANLNLHPGSSLILHEDCNVIIEPGATLTYYNGAQIFTKNETGYLVIRGNLNLEDNATFTVDHSYATVSGCVVFEGSPQVNAKPGSKIFLNSKGKNDPILAVRANTTLKFSDPDLTFVRLEECGVDLSATNSSIRFEQPVFTKNTLFSGAESEAGKIIVTDINQFYKTDFQDMYIGALLNIENKATLNVMLCDFTQTNPTAHNGGGIYVTGRNYSIRSSTFAINASGNAVIESEALTMGSIITNCSFNSTNIAIGETAVYDFSNTQIKISKSDFNHLKECVHKSMGTLSLKCNRFVDTYQNSVIAGKYCLLNMSINQGAGYNTFTAMTGSTSDRSHILLAGGEIYMDMGLNYFADVPITGGLVRGKVSSNCVNTSNCLMDFGGNQWASNPTSPPVSSNRFFIRSLNNIPVTVSTESPVGQLQCGTYGGTVTVLDPETASSPVKMGLIPTYYSEIKRNFIRLDEGIDAAIANLTSISDDSTGNDLLAIQLFDEIFSSSIDYFSCSPSSKRMLEIAESKMKIALESLFDQGVIDQTDNVSVFESSVEAYTNALNKLTSDAEIKETYSVSFRAEMNKAHLLRLIGHPDKSIDVLEHLEECGVDFNEQELINFEKTNDYEDHYVIEVGNVAIDTPFVIDARQLLEPLIYAGPFSFGTMLNELDDFTYSDCQSPKSLAKSQSNGLVIFPNPARDVVQFQIKSENMEGFGSLKIVQVDGREMYQNTSLDFSLNNAVSVNTTNWAAGAYHYALTTNSGKKITGLFIVQ